MPIKVSELTGPALDWAVWSCIKPDDEYLQARRKCCPYSSNWAQGGPIIEQEKINISVSATAPWMAWVYDGLEMTWLIDGPTPLIAAMRCFVSANLGDEVEIPRELL
jgi:hypothetical protein